MTRMKTLCVGTWKISFADLLTCLVCGLVYTQTNGTTVANKINTNTVGNVPTVLKVRLNDIEELKSYKEKIIGKRISLVGSAENMFSKKIDDLVSNSIVEEYRLMKDDSTDVLDILVTE